jgi:Putative zinc-finger
VNNRENVERLVSRFLDGECSPEERRQLEEFLKHDHTNEALFDEYASLDREFSTAMKTALGRAPLRVRRDRGLLNRGLRSVAMVAAALAAVFLWRTPPQPAGRNEAAAGMTASTWFIESPALPGDGFSTDSARYDRPVIRQDRSDREWIVVPAARAGEFMVIEVKRVRTRQIPIQDDF